MFIALKRSIKSFVPSGFLTAAWAIIFVRPSIAEVVLWNPIVKPPLQVVGAVTKSDCIVEEKVAAPHGYCFSGRISGEGIWQISNCLPDHRVAQVCIDPGGGGLTGSELSYTSRPDLWSPKLKPADDLPALLHRIERGVRKVGIEARIESSNDVITIAYHTRTIAVHELLAAGGFGKATTPAVCPEADGLFVRIRVVNEKSPTDTYVWSQSRPLALTFPDSELYWTCGRTSSYLSRQKKYLEIEWRSSSVGVQSFIGEYDECGECRPAFSDRDRQLPALALTEIIRGSLGSDSAWVPASIPPLSAVKASKIATSAIASEKRAYHCIRFDLWGDPYDCVERGSWRFIFASQNGLQKLVTVKMNGDVYVVPLNLEVRWRKWLYKDISPAFHANIRNPADAVLRLKPLFSKYNIKPTIALLETEATFEYHLRNYSVYASQNGKLGCEPVMCCGPDVDGFWLRVKFPSNGGERSNREATDTKFPSPFESPYWFTSANFPVRKSGLQPADTGPPVLIELRLGCGNNSILASDIERCFSAKATN